MRNRPKLMLLGAALCGIGLSAPPALASGVRVYNTHGLVSVGGLQACQSYGCGLAGTLSINGCRTSIRSGPGVDAEIALAFRRAGYDAVCSQGRVVVRFGHRRPSLGWLDRDFTARFGWDRNYLVITTAQKRCNACSACRPPVYRDTCRPAPVCPPPRVTSVRDHDRAWGVRWSSRRWCR